MTNASSSISGTRAAAVRAEAAAGDIARLGAQASKAASGAAVATAAPAAPTQPQAISPGPTSGPSGGQPITGAPATQPPAPTELPASSGQLETSADDFKKASVAYQANARATEASAARAQELNEQI